jgi:hypothetical protein
MLGLAPLAGHELPDGVAERAMQVLVFPDHIRVEYQFGMNEATLREQLEARAIQPQGEIAALEGQWLEQMAAEVPRNLDVRLDNQKLQVAGVQPRMIYLHHTPFACELTYAWDGQGEGELVIEDRYCAQLPGHSRLAIKAREGAQLRAANAPPILARAERQPFGMGGPESALPRLEAAIGEASAAPAVLPATRSPSGTEQPVAQSATRQPARRSLPLWFWLAAGGLALLCSLPFLLGRSRAASRR